MPCIRLQTGTHTTLVVVIFVFAAMSFEIGSRSGVVATEYGVVMHNIPNPVACYEIWVVGMGYPPVIKFGVGAYVGTFIVAVILRVEERLGTPPSTETDSANVLVEIRATGTIETPVEHKIPIDGNRAIKGLIPAESITGPCCNFPPCCVLSRGISLSNFAEKQPIILRITCCDL